MAQEVSPAPNCFLFLSRVMSFEEKRAIYVGSINAGVTLKGIYPLRIPLELEHKLGGFTGDLQGSSYSVTPALCPNSRGILRGSSVV